MATATFTIPFAHIELYPSTYNGWTVGDAEKDVAHWFNSWYPEFVFVSLDWVTSTITAKANEHHV